MKRKSYYSKKLAGKRLQLCYEVAPPRIKRYLQSEINLVRQKISEQDIVLELGCGYGRFLKGLVNQARTVVGIDLSYDNLSLAKNYLNDDHRSILAQMNAIEIGFPSNSFDLVCCIQNGISAFNVDPHTLIASALQITKPGGLALFSSYSEGIWEERLDWFEIQSSLGLIGEIDYEKTQKGTIVCKDGFQAKTFSPAQFKLLTEKIRGEANIYIIDESSVICEIEVAG